LHNTIIARSTDRACHSRASMGLEVHNCLANHPFTKGCRLIFPRLLVCFEGFSEQKSAHTLDECPICSTHSSRLCQSAAQGSCVVLFNIVSMTNLLILLKGERVALAHSAYKAGILASQLSNRVYRSSKKHAHMSLQPGLSSAPNIACIFFVASVGSRQV